MTEAEKIKLKEFFFIEYGLKLTDKQLLECYESLYYLAKAIIRFCELKMAAVDGK